MSFNLKNEFFQNHHIQKIGAAALFSIPLIILVIMSWHIASRVVYSLDDPYIHLALAKKISTGHYGINSDSYSAPSSSLLWPFILAPWAWLGNYFDIIPLIINWACSIATGLFILDLLKEKGPQGAAIFQTIFVMFCLNVWGVAFTGMEHSLQLLMTTIISSSLVKKHYNWHFWLSITLLPWVRYEGLAITLPTLAWITWQFFQNTPSSKSNLSAIIISLLISLGGLAAFSIWLHSVNLGWMPSSILSKTGSLFDYTPDLEMLEGAISNIHHQSFNLTGQLLLILAFINACSAFYHKKWSWGILIVTPPSFCT